MEKNNKLADLRMTSDLDNCDDVDRVEVAPTIDDCNEYTALFKKICIKEIA